MTNQLNGHELPVDKQAAFSYAKGETFEPILNKQILRFKIQPPTVEFTGLKKDDLTGIKFSRITVIGFFPIKKRNPLKGTSWLVRCSCGIFETRWSKTIKNNIKNPHFDACAECRYIGDKKRHHEYLRLGYNKHTNDYYF